MSRGDDQPLALKPVANLTASTGPLGGARVQYDLRKMLLIMNALALAKPEVFIGGGATEFDAVSGQSTEETTHKFVADQMLAFERRIAGCRRPRSPA
ncbi:MAG: hypothetical protein Q8L49_07790 [Burkholderiaceae bacterium]|nr:hypothetical protein [Burkholderiaceae bacterium]